MKTKALFLMSFISCMFFSCSENSIDIDANQKSDDIIISKIELTGDYVDISTFPLTRIVGESAYYAFQIDSMSVTIYEDIFGSYKDTTYYHYCEGVFESMNNISVSLEKGHTYRVKCAILEDGEDVVYCDEAHYLYDPLASSTYGHGSKTLVTNTFVYGGNQTLWTDMNTNCTAVVNDNQRVLHPRINRYFGETITTGGTISIPVERLNFGLRFMINPPQEGELKVYQSYGTPKFQYILTPESSPVNETHIYMLGPANRFCTITLRVEWKRSDGSVVDLSPAKFRGENKTITDIKVDVNDRIGGTDIIVEKDDNMTYGSEVIVK